jgi:hypothetical protein
VGGKFQIPADRHNCTDDDRGVLVGFGAGGILNSILKQSKANTHYAALISFPNGQE